MRPTGRRHHSPDLVAGVSTGVLSDAERQTCFGSIFIRPLLARVMDCNRAQ